MTEPMTTRDMQRRVIDWHGAMFPGAPNAAIGLKLAEEAGECAKAVNRLEHSMRYFDPDTPRHTHGNESITAGRLVNLREEIGDVAIVLMVLCGRYGLSLDAVMQERVEAVVTRPLKDGAV